MRVALALAWPVLGLRRFVARPRWWPRAVIGSLGGLLAVAAVAFVVAWFRWPRPAEGDSLGWGDYLGVVGAVIDAVVTLLAVMLPFTKGGAGRAVLRQVLAEQGLELPAKGGGRSLPESLRYLLLTLGWRVFWVVVVWVAATHSGALGTVVGLWAIGHLVALDACDHVLAFRGVPFAERRWKLALRAPLVLIAGAVGGLLALLLTVTVIGWLLWGPAMFVGAALWIADWRAYREPGAPAETGPQQPARQDLAPPSSPRARSTDGQPVQP